MTSSVFDIEDAPLVLGDIADTIEAYIGHQPKHLVVIVVNEDGMAQTLALSQDPSENFVRLIRESAEQRQRVIDGKLSGIRR